jgi:hypothetical protein
LSTLARLPLVLGNGVLVKESETYGTSLGQECLFVEQVRQRLLQVKLVKHDRVGGYTQNVLLLGSVGDIQVIRQRDTVARLNEGYFVFDVAVERDVTDRRFFNTRQFEARVESVLLAIVTQDERPALGGV